MLIDAFGIPIRQLRVLYTHGFETAEVDWDHYEPVQVPRLDNVPEVILYQYHTIVRFGTHNPTYTKQCATSAPFDFSPLYVRLGRRLTRNRVCSDGAYSTSSVYPDHTANDENYRYSVEAFKEIDGYRYHVYPGGGEFPEIVIVHEMLEGESVRDLLTRESAALA